MIPSAPNAPAAPAIKLHEIVHAVLAHQVDHVVITGGEPMLFAELIPLCEQLGRHGRHITVETAGTLYLPLHCDLMSISPKLSNSTPATGVHPRWRRRHDRTRHAPRVIRALIRRHAYQMKFVIDRPDDVAEVDRYLAQFPEIDRDAVMLMPQGTDADALAQTQAWLEPYCGVRGLRFCPRRQVEWFGLVPGT